MNIFHKNPNTMNYFRKTLIVISVAVIAGGLFACTDGFEELNSPPTSVTEINPAFLFTEVIRDTRIDYNWEYADARLTGGWAQHWADEDNSDGRPNYFNPHRRNDNVFWDVQYFGLKNLNRARATLLEEVDGDADDPSVRSRLAMVRIYEMYLFEKLTAGLGDIPYSEAIQGLELETTPVYDRQQEIYPDILNNLRTAVDNLTDGDLAFGAADILYNGNIDNWRRFGNSLYLRTAMRMRYADPGAAQSAVEDVMTRPLIDSHDQAAMVPTEAGNGANANAHPILAELRNPGDKSRVGRQLVEMLKDRDDPRLELMVEPTPVSLEVFNTTGDPDDLEYVGVGPNLTDEQYDQFGDEDISFAAFGTWNNEDLAIPVHTFTYPEVLYLQAEAALLGWGGGMADAQNYYEEGIRNAMIMEPYNHPGFLGYEITPADIDNYVASQTPLDGDFETALRQISEERYIMLFSRGGEVFFEWRRTGYPLLDPGTRTTEYTNGNIARKAFYHESEDGLNNANKEEAAQRMGDEGMNAIMWIDANPNRGQTFMR